MSTDPSSANNGDCTQQDYLTITSPTLGSTAGNYPQVCGTLTGMHSKILLPSQISHWSLADAVAF